MKNNLRIFAGTIIGVILLTIPIFLLPPSGVLTVSWIFSLGALLTLSGTLFWGNHRSGGEYVTTAAFPLAAVKYFIVELLFSIIMVFLCTRQLWVMPTGWYLFIHALLAGFFIWQLLAMDAGREMIENTGTAVEVKSSNWKELTLRVSILSTSAVPEVKKDISAVYEALRYSDPITDERLKDMENTISGKIGQISELISGGKYSEVPELCRQLLTDIKNRNEQCKTLKR